MIAKEIPFVEWSFVASYVGAVEGTREYTFDYNSRFVVTQLGRRALHLFL